MDKRAPHIVTITNCTFENNFVTSVYYGEGGAVRVHADVQMVTLNISACKFRGKRAAYGGACFFDMTPHSWETFAQHAMLGTNSSFEGNFAETRGSAMAISILSSGTHEFPFSITLSSVEFVSNVVNKKEQTSAETGGSLYIAYDAADPKFSGHVVVSMTGCMGEQFII